MNHAAVVVRSPSDFKKWPGWLQRLLRRETAGIPPQWQGSWLLAQGGSGTASLWVTYDDRNKVNGRMVVKSMVLTRDMFWDPTCWSDGLDAVGYRNYNAPIDHNMPLEAIIGQRLTQRAGLPVAPQTENPICQYLGHSNVDQTNRRWKLFLEYCPFGTLTQLQREFAHEGEVFFPEAFCWYVAEQCLLAAKIMEQGGTDAAVPGWRPLVHRDMKPSNILFGARDTTQFRHYPRIKICDFGLTCETDENDVVNNPIEFNDQGTLGFEPPEQKTWYKKNGDLDSNRRLSQKTQVWAIGFACWCIYCGNASQGLRIDYNDVNARIPPMHPRYAEFRNFLQACLQYDPDHRPTIDEALALVQAPVTGRDNFQGMRTAAVAAPLARDNNPNKLLVYPKHEHDPYRLKVARGTLPPLR